MASPSSSLAAEPVDFDPFAGPALERAVPTTEAQREVWLADRLGRAASLAFNESVRITLDGPLDAVALRAALDVLVARHESLRATLSADGLSMLVAAHRDVPLEVADLRGLDTAAREAALAEVTAAAVDVPFDLVEGPLLRAALLRLTDTSHLLVLAAHHVICDGWSFGIVARELARLYDLALGRPASALAPADRYADYAAREAARATDPEVEADAAFWSARFADGAPLLELPTDRPRPAVRGFASRREDHLLEVPLVAELKRFAGGQGASLFGVLAGGFAATLARIAGQPEVVLGVPTAGQSEAGMPSLVGHCVNLLPVRIAVDPQASASELLAGAQSALMDAFEHPRITFGTLLRRLQVPRDAARLPLVSVMFNLDQALELEGVGFDGLSAHLASVPRTHENFELFVNATQEGGALRLECQYNTALFDAATVTHWLAAFEALLRGVLATPQASVARLPMLDAGQRARLAEWNATAVDVDATLLVHERVARQADATPDALAIVAGRARATHAELRDRARRIAHALRERGVRPGDRVGLCVERGIDLVAALLGTLAAGATYVPLDPAFPSERLAYMAQDAGLALLLTESSVAHRVPWSAERTVRLDESAAWIASLPATALDDEPPAPGRGERAAYLIYTSGSTGRPKGVAVPHRAVGNFLDAMRREPGLGPSDRLVAVTTLSFDIAVLELLLPLVVGGSVVVASRDDVLDGLALRGLLEGQGATTMQATPAGWRVLLEAGWDGAPGFKALVGGEALPADLAQRLLERCGEVWNLYGPTETTVWSTVWRVVDPRRGILIGRPIANTRVHVVDEQGEPCPIGVPGELLIAGDGVALGYHDRPELTAERFIPDPGAGRPGATMYRTGDRGRWRADGRLEHLGRLDAQVKVRGFRIELGEIESALRTHPAVLDAVAIVREDRAGDPRLVGYWVARDAAGVAPQAAAFGAHLKRSLPDYMVPLHLVRLDAVPRLPNGKLDRRALPVPDAALAADRATEPRSELERSVAAAMERALGLPGLGPDDDFFMLGGHSLLAARVIAQLNRQLGARLSLRTLFESPTVARLAHAIEREAGGGADVPPIARRTVRGTAPLSLNQERMWFLERLNPGRTVYNTPSAHRLRGRLDAAALGRALQRTVDRHEVLRTTIEPTAEGAVQRIHAQLDVSALPLEDLRGLPAETREATLAARIDTLVETPFELSMAPLFVVRLFRLADEEHVLFFMPHHAIWDGWSFDLFYDEMSAGYLAELDGRAPALPALEVSYGDYAAWQRDWLASDAFEAQAAHWRQRFAAGAGEARRGLMTDRPRGATMTGEGRTEWLAIDRPLTERLRELGRAHDATLFMTLLSAYLVLLAGLGANGRQVVGIPVRGRSHPETEPLMGYFTNLLPLQVELRRDEGFRALQDRVRRAMLESFTFPDVPLERLVDDVPGLRGGGPLYQALFSFQDARRRPSEWGNLRHERLEVSQRGATEDLGLWLVERPGGLVGGVTWHADLYEAHTAQRLRERFLAILAQIVEAPDTPVDTLLGLDDAERTRLDAWLTAPPETRNASGADGGASPATPSRSEPATDTERRLAEVWSGLLGVARIGREDNFLDLGGHSLLVMQAVAAMEGSIRRRIDARRYVFETLAQIAAGYDEAPPIAEPKRGLVARLFGGGRG